MWTSKGGHAAQVFESVVTIIARTADQGHSSLHPLEKRMGLPYYIAFCHPRGPASGPTHLQRHQPRAVTQGENRQPPSGSTEFLDGSSLPSERHKPGSKPKEMTARVSEAEWKL